MCEHAFGKKLVQICAIMIGQDHEILWITQIVASAKHRVAIERTIKPKGLHLREMFGPKFFERRRIYQIFDKGELGEGHKINVLGDCKAHPTPRHIHGRQTHKSFRQQL